MKLRLLLAVLLPLTIGVAGCSQTLSNVGTVLSINQPQVLDNARLGQIHDTYQLFLATAVSIRKNFPQCRANENPSPTNLCYKRSHYLAVQTLTRQAQQLVTNIDTWARENPTIDAGALIDAFNKIITQGTNIVTSIQTGGGGE